MLIQSPIIIEEFNPVTNVLKSSWRIKEVYVDSKDAVRDEVNIHFTNSNHQEILVPLLSANIRVYSQCMGEGKLTIRLNTPTPMHVMISQADPEILKLFHSFLLQFTQPPTLAIKNRANLAVKLFDKKMAEMKEKELYNSRRRLINRGENFDEVDVVNYSKRSRNSTSEKTKKIDAIVSLHRNALRTIRENELNGSNSSVRNSMNTLNASVSNGPSHAMGSENRNFSPDKGYDTFSPGFTGDAKMASTLSCQNGLKTQNGEQDRAYTEKIANLLDDILCEDMNIHTSTTSSRIGGVDLGAKVKRDVGPPPSRTAAPSFNLHSRISIEELEKLSMSQRRVLDIVASGASVFFSGPAGTGKSHLLGILKTILPFRTCHFTSTTGITAVGLGGSTLWHWLGVNLSQSEGNSGKMNNSGWNASKQGQNMNTNSDNVVETAIARIRKNNDTLSRIRYAQTLIIDEISMLSATSLSNLDLVLKTIRNNKSPMGGIQLIICGDFFQLPPVISGNSSSGIFAKPGMTYQNSGPVFAFESPVWARIFTPSQIILLQRVYRQSDTTFIDTLNRLRIGDVYNVDKHFADALERGRIIEEARQRAIDIHSFANAGMSAVSTESYADASVKDSENPPNTAVSSSQADLVRRVASISSNLDVLATLRDFSDATWLLTRKYQVDALNKTRLEALTGETVTITAIDSGISSVHMQYLQKSCPAKDALQLKVGALVILTKNVSVAEGLCNGARGVVLRFTSEQLPVVYFPTRKKVVVLKRERYPLIIGGQTVAEREMIPLDLAWAVSVHKSQGMTLDKAIVDISQVFEYGQAYVALSRLRSLDGLALVGYKPQFVCAHPLVKQFYAAMERLQDIE